MNKWSEAVVKRVKTVCGQGGEVNRALTGREALGVRSANTNTATNMPYPGSPGRTRPFQSQPRHLFLYFVTMCVGLLGRTQHCRTPYARSNVGVG